MSQKNSDAKLGSIIGYTFPRLHQAKDWYVDFQAIDPASGKLKRKKYYITKSSKREMRASADALIEKLGIKLRQGWTPWDCSGNQRGTKSFDEILIKYLAAIDRSSRKTTLESYSSRVNILREYMKTNPIKYAFQFDRSFVTDFLDWIVETSGNKRGIPTNKKQLQGMVFCNG
ncbi:MAG: hypothetical protein HDR88_01820 [Bacteroides sp.]|nr:hypothetical protein [Bacteroides sp.]